MKTKILLLIAGAAVVTLSFTFASKSPAEQKQIISTVDTANEPAGGFILEEK